MLTSLLLLFGLQEKKTVHYDLGQSDGLTLSADLDILIEDHSPYKELTYSGHFFARDIKGQVVDQKHVDLGTTTDKPLALLVEDRFHLGYKQFFISLHFGAIQTYLFAFRNRKFYTAFLDNSGRENVKVLSSPKNIWKLDVSAYCRFPERLPRSSHYKTTETSISRTIAIKSTSKPVINVDLATDRIIPGL